MKLTKRKGFNFFRSYFDVYNELNDKEKVMFIDALLERQFLGIKPKNLTGMAKFAYISQTNSIDSQVKGFEDKTGIILTPTEPPTDGGNVPPTVQVEEKGEVEEKEKGEEQEQGVVSVWPSFLDFWDKYDKKQDKPKCEKKWEKIKQVAREKIMLHLEVYIPSTPDKQYRKNPLTYLNSESWENEIIIPNNNGTTFTDRKEERVSGLRAAFAKQVIDRSKGT
jgi:hypothetical protein